MLREIRQLSRAGKPIAASRVPRPLYGAAKRYVGCWDDAVRAAGSPPGAHRLIQSWSRTRVRTAILERRRQRMSNSPSVVATEDSRLYGTAERLYGSWRRAVRAAGIDPATYKGPWKWTQARARAWVEDRVARGLPMLKKHVPEGLYARVRADTGRGWGAFVESLGIAYAGPPPRRRWSRDALVAAIRERIRRGLPITAFAVQKDEQSLKHAARNHFGSWGAALQAAGIRPRPLRRAWDEAGVLAAIRSRREDGGVMRETVVAIEDERLFAAATARFGSWQAALAAAGQPRLPRGRAP